MKALITGASGAVGSALKTYLEGRGDTVVTWDRARVPIDNYHAMEQFILSEKPDALFHLATASTPTGRDNESWLVNYEWTSELAWICRVHNIRFVFTSSVLVFTNDAKGPFTPESEPDATEGYGYEKLQAERRVFHQNPDAVVARLGWQIGESAGSNNMIDFFEKQMREHGQVNASRQWYPACSFISDTVETLVKLSQGKPGLYLVDSNERWTFYEIALALNFKHGSRWNIVPNDDFVYDQRMIDPRTSISSIRMRLIMLWGVNFDGWRKWLSRSNDFTVVNDYLREGMRFRIHSGMRLLQIIIAPPFDALRSYEVFIGRLFADNDVHRYGLLRTIRHRREDGNSNVHPNFDYRLKGISKEKVDDILSAFRLLEKITIADSEMNVSVLDGTRYEVAIGTYFFSIRYVFHGRSRQQWQDILNVIEDTVAEFERLLGE